jgi:hypothetical protein
MNLCFYLKVFTTEKTAKGWVHFGIGRLGAQADLYMQSDKMFCGQIALSNYDLEQVYRGLTGGYWE